MQFLDDSLFPENQEPLVIQAAPYGPEYIPSDSDDIAVSLRDQVQKAVDCYNAGATVLHVHVREENGKGSKRLSMFNELLARLREAVPGMLLQVGGSISFAPESDGSRATWLPDDTRHMLAELSPKPDQVTIVINTSQFGFTETLTAEDVAGTQFERPEMKKAYDEMIWEAGPDFYVEHLRRLQAAKVQPHFMIGHVAQLGTLERILRRGQYTGPLCLNYLAFGGGLSYSNPVEMMEFISRVPDGAVLTIEGLMRNNLPMSAMAIAMGLHVRCGIEDNLWGRKGERVTSVQQVEKMVTLARMLYRDVASAEDARRIYRIGQFYRDADETLARLGMPPNRARGQKGVPTRAA
ncbi:MAG TPA: 3-keto-5-aminohexanoate cleavage protein [Burkholderiaceae bacterium]|nr:3-keto-5-aminohexanoate cleavage protein [Burkholderiaceae bacterium]